MEYTDSTSRCDLFSGYMAAYLVERYLPGTSFRLVQLGAERLADASEELTRKGVAVTYLGSTFLPDDEAVFDLVLAPSIAAVATVSERAGTKPARVSEVILIGPRIHAGAPSNERVPGSRPSFDDGNHRQHKKGT